ncbi:hypothetical protein D9M68_542900 [compost metagenome]
MDSEVLEAAVPLLVPAGLFEFVASPVDRLQLCVVPSESGKSGRFDLYALAKLLGLQDRIFLQNLLALNAEWARRQGRGYEDTDTLFGLQQAFSLQRRQCLPDHATAHAKGFDNLLFGGNFFSGGVLARADTLFEKQDQAFAKPSLVRCYWGGFWGRKKQIFHV